MLNSKGFVHVEVIMSIGTIFMFITMFVPLIADVHLNRHELKEKRLFSTYLHDDLQLFLWQSTQTLPQTYSRTINNQHVEFTFTEVDGKLMKGCVQWTPVNRNIIDICLYGYQKTKQG